MQAALPIVGSVAGSLFGRASAQSAGTPGVGESQALSGQANAGQGLLRAAQQASGTGAAATTQAAGYFSKLAQGSKADMTTALAPETSAINQAYTGAGKSISRFLRGPDRSVQLGEMQRERSGQIANLFASSRQNANTQLAGIGAGATSAGTAAYGGASGAFGSGAQQGAYNRITGEQIQSQAGEDWGNLFGQLLKGYANRPGQSGLQAPTPGAF